MVDMRVSIVMEFGLQLALKRFAAIAGVLQLLDDARLLGGCGVRRGRAQGSIGVGVAGTDEDFERPLEDAAAALAVRGQKRCNIGGQQDAGAQGSLCR